MTYSTAIPVLTLHSRISSKSHNNITQVS